jgi:hypothetical protein
MADVNHKNTNKSLIMNKKCAKAFDADMLGQLSKNYINRTFTVNQTTRTTLNNASSF